MRGAGGTSRSNRWCLLACYGVDVSDGASRSRAARRDHHTAGERRGGLRGTGGVAGVQSTAFPGAHESSHGTMERSGWLY